MKHIAVDRAENEKCCGEIVQKMIKLLLWIVQNMKRLLWIAQEMINIVVDQAENETY